MGAVPIVNLPNLYINGLQVAVEGNTDLSVAAGQCRDSTDAFDIVVDAELGVDFTTNGAGGIDTGTIAASAWYYIYVISDPTANNVPAAIASLSATGPLMPYGYGVWRFVGVALTNSSQLQVLYVSGSSNERRCFWDTTQTCDTVSALVPTNYSLANGVPPIDLTPVLLNPVLNISVVGNCAFRYPGSSATDLPRISAPIALQDTYSEVEVMAGVVAGVSTIQGVVSATGTCQLVVNAFTLYL